MNTDQFHQKFENAKSMLNDEQRRAVETIEGPVLVVAGPGTGKTQVLSVRVAEILSRQVGISPYNILCLTYTDAAAVNMRKRLSSFIGTDAHKVHISTYHSFCSEVIQRYAHYFERPDGKRLVPVDEINYFDTMRTFLLNLDVEHPLKRSSGNLMQDHQAFKALFSVMDTERFSPEFLKEKIKAHIDEISSDTTNKEFFYVQAPKTGQPKDALAKAIKQFERLAYAVDLKPKFDELMLNERGFYTYDQMILFVIEALKTYPHLLADLQERYQYILVDEYQDTNNSQNEILFLLAEYWQDNPNLFVVGDDDQSIFRFQGANTENIRIFQQKFARYLTTIRLEKNYRSSQHILDVAECFIQKNTDRLLSNKQLSAQVPQLQIPENNVHIVRYANTFEEEVGVVQRIQQWIAQGVPLDEIAILYKKHKHSEHIEKLLRSAQIPFTLQKSTNILQEKFIEQTITILTYLSRESISPYSRQNLLFDILHYDFFAIPRSLIVALFERNDRKKTPHLLSAMLEANATHFPGFEFQDIHKLKWLANTLEDLMVSLHNLTVQGFVEKVIYDLGIVEFAHRSEDKVTYLEQLYTLFFFIKNETERQPFQSIHYFIERIEEYKKQKEAIPSYRMIQRANSVKLMTVFASKGLEFEYVLMIKNTEENWEKSRNKNQGFKLPPNVLHYQKTSAMDEDEKVEELRRLFYVGITRAKKQAFLSYAEQSTEGKQKFTPMSSLMAELIQTGKTPIPEVEHIPLETVNLSKLQEDLFQLLLPPPIDKAEIELKNISFVQQKLEAFRLSASSLHTYLECPISFYYNQILRIPRASSPDQGYGKAVHTALKHLYPNVALPSKSSFLSRDEFLNAFLKDMYKYQSYFTKDEFTQYVARGEYKLPLFYDAHIEQIKRERIVQTEYPIHAVIEGVQLFGILDKLVFDGNAVTITDYKTGSFAKSQKETSRLSPISEKHPYGGSYWRQGAFYKILVDHIYLKRPEKKWKTEKVVFQYVEQEDGIFQTEKFLYTDEQIQQLLAIIREAWANIQALRFTEGCNKSDCEWCNFAKTNQMNVTHLRTSTMEE